MADVEDAAKETEAATEMEDAGVQANPSPVSPREDGDGGAGLQLDATSPPAKEPCAGETGEEEAPKEVQEEAVDEPEVLINETAVKEDADTQGSHSPKRPREDGNGRAGLQVDGASPPAKKHCAGEAGEEEAQKEVQDEAMAEPEALVNDAAPAEEGDNDADGDDDDDGGDGTAARVTDSEGGKGEVKLGPVLFTTSVQMFRYFYDLLHGWPLDFPVNKYEHLVLLDLIHKGHSDPPSKVGPGIIAFHVRVHPEFHSRCYYLIRKDGTTENFSYRKCVDKLLPLPSDMKSASGDFDLDKILSGDKSHKGDGRNFHGGQNRGGYNNRGRRGKFGGRRGRGGRRN